MANPVLLPPVLHRDGSSQAARAPAALDAKHVAIDERSAADLLAFVREYTKQLVYHGDDGTPQGDLGGLLGPEPDLDAMVAFMADPQGVHDRESLDRPHLSLLLAFLELLRHAQGQLNGITRRHLEFHFRTILGMTPRPAVPDQVNVLVEPSRGTAQVRLPAGSRLHAGKDDEGTPRIYQTDRDVVVSHAQVVELRSVHVERQATSLRDTRLEHDDDPEAAMLAMLSVALGEPGPGEPLALVPAGPGVGAADAVLDVALLRSFGEIVAFVPANLFLELYELRAVLQLHEQRIGADADAEWAEINDRLQEAARQRLTDPAYVFSPVDPRDFETNVADALGGTPDFSSLTGIDSLEELYHQRVEGDAAAFITTDLHFPDVESFARMMQLRLTIEGQWREINRILEQAARRRLGDPSYSLVITDPTDVDTNVSASIGPVDYSALVEINDPGQCQQAIDRIEDYFELSAEDVAFLAARLDDTAATGADWDTVEALLANAYAERVYERRRAALAKVREGNSSEGQRVRATFSLGLDQPLGPATAVQLYSLLEQWVGSDFDRALLLEVAHRVDTSAEPVTADEWARIDTIVELAQRSRERLPVPVPEIVEWLDIHPHTDATAVTTSLELEADRDIHRWKTFGTARVHEDQGSPPAPVLGWGLRSPLLALREGQRTITITLGFLPDKFEVGPIGQALPRDPLAVQLQTAAGWVEAELVTIEQGDYQQLSGVARTVDPALPALRLTVTLPPQAAALEGPSGSAPALRLMLRPVWDDERSRYVTLYEPLGGLTLDAVHIAVDVVGLTSLRLENDDGTLDARKPFTPFGRRPTVGSQVFIGHPELVDKRLDHVRFHVDWMRVPADLAQQYQHYGINNPDPVDPTGPELPPDFQVQIDLHDDRRDLTLTTEAPLFDSGDARASHSIELADVPAAVQAAVPGHAYERRPGSTPVDDPERVSTWARYLRWELSPLDFQHDAYPVVATLKANEMSAAVAAAIATPPQDGSAVDVADYQVKPPYTPTIKRLSVDYGSSAELRITEATGDGALDVLHHVHPFGTCELTPGPDGVPLLPRYDRYEGELYIGLRDVAAPQNLSLLVQMAEGSADPDLPGAAVEWSVLSGDRWVDLHDGSMRADGTRGLRSSGIVELSLPAVEPGASLPGGQYWLRAAIPRYTGSVCDTIAIATQAVSATFVDQGNAPAHYDVPLPAGTITKLASSVRGVAKIHQPYTGFGGSRPEQDAALDARVSERLRHKQRALTVWDYERLVLQRFPQIYKAKCLPARLDAGALPSQGEPGKVVVVVIPDIRNQIPFDPFEPKAPASTLAEIEAWLGDKVPGSATVEVRNAHYIAVKVRVSVRFYEGQDEGYARKTLNDEINRFLSPWAYDDGVDITIGERVYANSIIDFIDRRPYVDYVYGITLFRSDDGERFTQVEPSALEGYYVAAERADGVLVAARNHEIEIGAEGELAERTATGINYMTIGVDFVVSKPGLQGLVGIGFMGIEKDFIVGGDTTAAPIGIGRMSVAGSFRIG
ncbi:MAG: baseplate J/gp47 family protein [Myxococcota bacterium]